MKRNDDIVIPVTGPTLQMVEAASYLKRNTVTVNIDSDTKYEQCSEIYSQIVAQSKAYKKDLDDTIRPINEGVKRIRAMYKPALDSLTAAADSLKGAMLSYRAEQEQKRLEADKLARAALEQNRHAEAMVQIEKATTVTPRVAGTQVRKVWKIRIVDKTKIPIEFMEPNMAALRNEALEVGWDRNRAPAGVEFFQEEIIAAC